MKNFRGLLFLFFYNQTKSKNVIKEKLIIGKQRVDGDKMRGNLASLMIVPAIVAPYALASEAFAQVNYENCKPQVQNILGQVRKIEEKNGTQNQIGAVTPIPLVDRVTPEEQSCIAKGVGVEAPEYEVSRSRSPQGTIFYFKRVKVKS